MTDTEIFHHASIRYGFGPRLAREQATGTSAGNTYELVAHQAEDLITAARHLMTRLPHIHFDFVWNGVVNAFTFKEQDQYFIGITSGAIVLLSLVFNRILADSQLLPHVGNPGAKPPTYPGLSG